MELERWHGVDDRSEVIEFRILYHGAWDATIVCQGTGDRIGRFMDAGRERSFQVDSIAELVVVRRP
jgi:glutamate-1-semialdehyde aminotransferase